MAEPKEPPQDKKKVVKIEKIDRIQGFGRENGKMYFFLPTCVDINVKEFSSLSVSEQSVKLRATLTIKVRKLPQEFHAIEKCINKGLKVVLFSNRWKLTVNEKNGKKKIDQNGDISWIYEIDQEVFWKPDLFWLPFDRQSLPVSVRIGYLKTDEDDRVRYYFNILNEDSKTKKQTGCMKLLSKIDKKIAEEKTYLSTETIVEKLKDFKLSYYQPRYEFMKEWIGKQEVEYCPQTIFYFSLTRIPLKLILKVLVPNFILQVITIILFFTDNDFGTRVASIIGIMLAIVAFLPSVHEESPHIRGITLMDLLILPGPINAGLLLFETALKRHTPGYENKGWWIAACCLVALTVLTVVLCSLWRFIEYFCIRSKKKSFRKMREDKSNGKKEKEAPKEGSLEDAMAELLRREARRNPLTRPQDLPSQAHGAEEFDSQGIELIPLTQITIPEYDFTDIERDPNLTYLDKCYIKRQRRRNEETNITLFQ